MSFVYPMSFFGSVYLASLSFVEGARGSSSVTVPASTQSGDLIIFCELDIGLFSPPSEAYPEGFTKIGSAAFSTLRLSCSAKIAETSDFGRSLNSVTGSAGSGSIVIVLRGNIPVNSFSSGGFVWSYGNDDPPALTIQSSLAQSPAVAVAWQGSIFNSFDISATTMVPTHDVSMDFPYDKIKLKFYNSSPSDTTIDMIDVGSGMFQAGFYVSVN